MHGFKLYNGLENRKYIIPAIPEPPKVSKKSADDILDMIYSIDPDTLLINGDVSLYLGEQTAPEVRQFIQNQLMRDNTQSSNLHLSTSQVEEMRNISDDLRVQLMRGDTESVEDYEERITRFLTEERNKIVDERKRKEVAKYFDKKD